MPRLQLLPTPRSMEIIGGTFRLPADVYIVLEPHSATRDVFAAERFVIDAESLTATRFHITMGASIQHEREIRVRFEKMAGGGHEQGYRLRIMPGEGGGIELAASTAAGTFYGFQTLLQILRQAAFSRHHKVTAKNKSQLLALPCVTIEDWPDFMRRGVYHDCARGKVPTVDTLLQLIDDLGHLKVNEFQLYIENTFEFRRHPEMYDDTTPFTAEEILLLDAACRARHIDFVPSLTSLGHFEKILKRPGFRHLAEADPEELKKAGVKTWCDDPWTLCVTDPAAKDFLKEMYDEFVPNFRSPQFNICCDESWDLGKGRSKELADKIGVGQMYVDWINTCNTLSKGHGKRIQMWGDIILNHPELIAQLPADATLLEWGYESHHAFDEHCAIFAARIRKSSSDAKSVGDGQEFYVAPGTASWLSLASRTRNALGNIHNAATAGLKHGARGLLVTDWGDNGHQQLLAVSMLPFAYGAAAGWNLAGVSNPAIAPPPDWSTGLVPSGAKASDRALQPFLEAASLHLFLDPTKTFAALAYDLGLTYERFGWQRFNGSLEWFLFREKWDFANYVNRALPNDLKKVIDACETLRLQFENASLGHDHAATLRAEFVFTCDLIVHTCRRTLLRQHWLEADPVTRNPEDESRRNLPPVPLLPSFVTSMQQLAKEVRSLKERFVSLWNARNKASRLADVVEEFARLGYEYKKFGKAITRD